MQSQYTSFVTGYEYLTLIWAVGGICDFWNFEQEELYITLKVLSSEF